MKWRTFSSIVVASLIVGFAVGGCGGDDGGGDTNETTKPYTPPADADPKLEFVANQSQTLEFGASVDLAIRYVDQTTGNGLAKAPIDFVIEGDAGGSQLGAVRATTDASGNAGVSLTAGQQNATFQVKVSPPANGGEPISFQIAVSDQPIGSITVAMSYLGELTLENLVPSLHKGVSCDGLDPNALPTPLQTTNPGLADIDETTGFVSVDVASDYAVTVTGNVGPNIRAFGCYDGIAVEQSKDTPVKVALYDLDWPGPVLGTYDLVNELDFGGTLPDSVQLAVDILDELTDDQDVTCNDVTEDYGQDPGAFLTDFVMRQTCHWECEAGEDYDTCSQINHGWGDISAVCKETMTSWDGGQPRFFGGCGAWETAAPWVQDQINGYITQYVPGGVLAFAEMAGDLARAINQAKIYSELNVQEGSDTAQPMTHRLVQMEVLLHDMAGDEHIFKFDMADVGLTSLQTNASLSVDVDAVTIPEHEFKLSYGKLIQYIYLNGLLPLFNYASSAEMFADWINCTSVGVWLADNVGFLQANDWAGYCDMGVTLAGDTFDTQLSGLIKAEGTLKLQGTCTATDIDPISNIAATLSNGKWIGTWGEDAGSTGNVSGTFVGTLQ
jgi:hypothetical protein